MKSNLAYSTDLVEYARRIDGQWFCREWGFNGYSNGWSKWVESEKPQLMTETKVWCDYTRGYRTVKRFRTIGFGKATRMAHNRLRLPN